MRVSNNDGDDDGEDDLNKNEKRNIYLLPVLINIWVMICLGPRLAVVFLNSGGAFDLWRHKEDKT